MKPLATSEIAALIGVPFVYGGRGPETFDCYGLLKHLYARQGVSLPDYRSPTDQARISALMGGQLTLWAPCEQKIGAAVVFRILGRVAHVGMVIDDDKFIHTWEGSGGVCVERLTNWNLRIYGFYEYVGPH